MVLVIASDHAGFEGKELIKKVLEENKVPYKDFGPATNGRVDYPEYGASVAGAVSKGEAERGILVCGSGIGMSIVANKFPRVRATLAYDKYTAEMSRQHNDSNVLVVGGRTTKPETIKEIVNIWLKTGFDGGRHADRILQIEELEKKLMK